MYRPNYLYRVRLLNNPKKVVTLTGDQVRSVLKRDMLGSDLDLDTYMSLIDPDWPI